MNTIQKAAFLEFKMVHPQSDELLRDGLTEPGYEVLRLKQKASDGAEATTPVLVKKAREMDGSSLRSAMVVRGKHG